MKKNSFASSTLNNGDKKRDDFQHSDSFSSMGSCSMSSYDSFDSFASSVGSIMDKSNFKWETFTHQPNHNQNRIQQYVFDDKMDSTKMSTSSSKIIHWSEDSLKLKRIHSESDIMSLVNNNNSNNDNNNNIAMEQSVEENDKKLPATYTPNISDDNIIMSPDEYLNLLFKSKHSVDLKSVPALSLPEDFFFKPTAKDISGFSLDVVTAIQESNIAALRALYHSGHTFQCCCNRFGESVIHMACRRGLVSVVSFLFSEADVKSIRIRDDYGRTPMHDCLWCREPNFEIMDMLIAKDAMLLFVTDKRGFTPFQYAKREDWKVWLQYLRSRFDILMNKVDEEFLRILSI